MAGKTRFVFHRQAFSQQVLHNKQLLDQVQGQMEAARNHPAVTIYRNEDGTHGNVVATAPAALEAKRGTLTQMLGRVHV